MQPLNRFDKKALLDWELKSKEIANATAVDTLNDTPIKQKKRIARALADYEFFCQHYFPHYYKAPCGDFHIKAANAILADHNIFAVLEWAREHAKSVHADILIPLWLKIHGQLDGMILAGKSDEDACKLLGDIQGELMNNQRYIHDFGEQFSFGSWEEGDFTTRDGINFIALGRGQSPRGIRNAEKRPNYCVVDDIEDDEIIRNEKRVREVVDWILGSLFGALAIKGARFVMVGNRIGKESILANIVGDIDPETPKRKGMYHSKVCAIENGKPAWWQNYSLEQLQEKMDKMGYRLSQREYFHNPITEGRVFKNEWIKYGDTLPYDKYDGLIAYCDPSFKSTAQNDYKAIILVGKTAREFHILKCFVRQCSVGEMVRWSYDLYELLNPLVRTSGVAPMCEFYMEANFLQDLLIDEYVVEGMNRNYQLPVRPDNRKKPQKFQRVEGVSPFFERGMVIWDRKLKGDKDAQTAVDQFLAFEPGSRIHDDAPDAFEGAVFLLQQRARSSSFQRIIGTRDNSNRW